MHFANAIRPEFIAWIAEITGHNQA